MRRALVRVTVAVAALVVAALGWMAWDAPGSLDTAFASRTADAGGVKVTVTPLRLDSRDARFQVSLDNHVVDLAPDVVTEATLSVGPAEWGPARWDGAGAAGHHLAGELVFAARGPLEGAVRLTIGGLSSPATFEWDVEQP